MTDVVKVTIFVTDITAARKRLSAPAPPRVLKHRALAPALLTYTARIAAADRSTHQHST